MATSQEYQQIVERIRLKYPPLTPHKFDIITGHGPGLSVFYPAHARQNPRPGTHVIETRDDGRAIEDPSLIEHWLAGEMFKLLGMRDANGAFYAMTAEVQVGSGR